MQSAKWDPLLRLRRRLRPVVLLMLGFTLFIADAPPASGQGTPTRSANGGTDRPDTPDAALAVARNGFALVETRVEAITTLQHFRTRRVAAVLIELIDEMQPQEVRQAAFASLAGLTGISDFPNEVARWNEWWLVHRDLDDEAWFQAILRNFARRNNHLNAQQEWAQKRLVEVQRRLFEFLPAADRSAALLNMVQDPIEAVRLLGLDLIARRLEQDLIRPDEMLMPAIRKLLDDQSPQIRRRAALQLRNLGDDEAADEIARRLRIAQEKNIEVLSAYLKMMDRVPKAAGAVAALELLRNPRLSADAAGALASAAHAGMLNVEQKNLCAQIVRSQLKNGQLPDPQAVHLLGHIGTEADWNLIEQWLDVNNEAVKDAAALAWERSERPLLPLAQRAYDQVIRPTLLMAAARRGKDLDTLLAIADRPPMEGQPMQPWIDALVAMAGRVEPAGLLQVDEQIVRSGQSLTLRERVMSAGISGLQENPVLLEKEQATLAKLLSRRAEIRLDNADAAAALNDYQAIAQLQIQLTAQDQLRIDRGTLHAHLSTGYMEGAISTSRRLLARADADEKQQGNLIVIESFLAAAVRWVDGSQPDRAKQTLTALKGLFPDGLPEAYRLRVTTLEEQVRDAEAKVNSPAESSRVLGPRG